MTPLFMAEMKSRYNVIILDSPPLGAGIDPFVLSTATGNMLLALRSGETERAPRRSQAEAAGSTSDPDAGSGSE